MSKLIIFSKHNLTILIDLIESLDLKISTIGSNFYDKLKIVLHKEGLELCIAF